MHPAYSVIFFTTASGAGYGLLALLGVFNAFDVLPGDRWFGLTAFVCSLGLITAGLLSSTFHLGHPERAWRAFSQWRTSWLSREGVASVLTYIPAGLFAGGWIFLERTDGVWAALGLLAAIGAAVTVYFTSMIYVSLRTIAAWDNKWVSAVYLVLALATGLVLLDAALRLFSHPAPIVSGLGIVALLTAWGLKIAYWKSIDGAPPSSTLASATGLGEGVRMFDPPHTGTNYLQQEMGYRVARKHAVKLRRISVGTLILLPAVLLGDAIALPDLGHILSPLAAISVAIGVVIERWLFFAEAKHVVSLYYGD